MATKTELEISREKITSARLVFANVRSWRDHALSIGVFWREIIEHWKYPQGQKRHGGRCWRKRMDEQITMELADLNTYWPTMLAQLDEVDKAHGDAALELNGAMLTIEEIVDGGKTVAALAPALTALRVVRMHLQHAIYIRETGNSDGKVEEEL